MSHTIYNERNVITKDTSHFMSYVPTDFGQTHKQFKNQLTSLQERNLKLKEDIWRNKQKLLGQGDFNNETVQIRSYSSNNNINISQMNTTYRPPIMVQPPIQNTRVFVTNQKTIQSNQNNMNIDNSQLLRYKSEVERYKLLIVQYEKKIEILTKYQRTYQREIETYKQRINKMNFMLQERQVQKQTIINKYTSEIQKLRSSTQFESQVSKKQCPNCQNFSKKIKQLTNHITELTNQLTSRTKKIKQLQQGNKQGIVLKLEQQIISLNRVIEQNTALMNQNQENFNKQFNQVVSQLNKQQSYAKQYEEKIQSYQNHVTQLNQYLDSLRSENSMLKSKGGLDSSQTNYGQEIKFLQEEITNLRHHLITAQQKSQQIRKQNINLTRQLSQQKSSFQRTINSLRTEYNQSESQNHNLRLTLQTSRAQYTEISSRYTYIQNEHTILQNKLKTVQSQSQNNGSSNEQITRLSQQNLSLNQQIVNFKSQIEYYQKQMKNLNIEMRRSYEALNQLKQKTKAEIPVEFVDQRVKAICHERQQNYKQQIEKLTFQLQHTKKMISQLFTKIQQGDRDQEAEDSELEREISERYKKHYQQIISKQNNEIDGLNGQIDRLLIDIRNMESGDQIQRYKKELMVKETHIFQLQNKIKNQQSIFKKYQTDLLQSRKRQQQTYKNLEQAETYIQSLQEQLRISKQQGTQISFSSNQKYQLEARNTELMNRNALLSSEIQRLIASNKELSDTLKQIQEQRMRGSPTKVDKSQWRQLSKTYEQLFKENDALRHSYSVLEKQTNTKNAELGMLKNQKPIHLQEIERLKVELEIKNLKYEGQYNQQVTINQKLQTTINQLNKLLQGLKKTISEQTSRILYLQNQLKNKQDQFGQKYLPRQQNEDKDMIDQLTNFQHIISELTQEKQDLITHLQAAQKYIFEFQEKNYQQIIRQLEHNIKILSDERTSLLRRQSELQRGLHEMDSGKNTVQDEAKINIYILQIKKLKERIAQLQNTIANLKRINLQLESKLKSSSTSERDNSNYKQKVQALQKDKQRVITQMNKVRQHLQRSPLPKQQVDPRLQQFIRRNHEIMEELAHAKLYISELEQKCEIYIRKSHHTSSSYQVKTLINTNMRATGFGQTGTHPLDSIQHTSTNSFNQGDSRKTQELQLIISRISSQKDQLLNKVKLIQNQKFSLENNYKENIRKLQNHNSTVLNEQKSSLNRSIQEYEIKIKRISQQSRILQDQIRNIRNSSVNVNANNQEIQILTQKNRKLQNDKAIISSQLQRLTQVISNFNIQRLNNDNLLREETSKIQKRYSQENRKLQNTINEHVLVIQKLQVQNARLNLQSSQTSQISQDQQLKNQVSKMSSLIKQRDEEIKTILQHLKQAQNYIGTHQLQFLAWQNEKEQVFVILREYEIRIKSLTQQNQNLLKRQQPSPSTLDIDTKKYDQSLRIIENLQKQILTKDNKNKELQSNYSVINIQLNNLKTEQAKWINEGQSLNLMKTTNQKLLQEQKQAQNALNNLKSQNKRLSQTNAHLLQENKTISLKISQNVSEQQDIKAKTQRAILASQLQRLSADLLKIKKQKDDLQRNYQLIKSENSQLKAKIQQIKNLEEQNRKLINEVNVYKSQKVILNKDTNKQLQLEQLNNQKFQILNKLRQAQDYIFKLEQEAQNIRPNLQTSQTLQKQLNQVKLQKQEILRKLLQSQKFLKNYEQVIKSQQESGNKNLTLQKKIKQMESEVQQLQKKLEKAESTIRQLQESIKQYQAKVEGIANLQKEIKGYKKQKQELISKLKQAQTQISSFNLIKDNKPEADPKISQLQKNYTILGQKLLQAQNYIIYLQENNEIIIQKIVQPIQKEIQKYKEEREQLIFNIIQAEKEINRLQNLNPSSSTQTNIAQFTRKIQKLQQESKVSNAKIIELQKQNRQILQKLQEAQAFIQKNFRDGSSSGSQENIKILKLQIERLNQQNNFNKSKLQEAEEYIQKCEKHKDQISEKLALSQRNIKNLYEQYSLKEGEHHHSDEEHDAPIQQGPNKQAQLLQTLENSRLKLHQKAHHSNTVTRLTEQNIILKKQVNTFIEQINAAKETFRRLSEQNKVLKRQSNTLAEQIEAAKQTFRTLTQQNISSRNQSTTLIEQVNAAKETFKRLVVQNTNLKRQTNTLIQQISAAKQTARNQIHLNTNSKSETILIQQINAAKESFKNLTEKNLSLTKQVHTLVEQLSAAKESYGNLTGQNVSLTKQVHTLVEQLSAAKESYGNLTGQNVSLTKQVNTLVEQLSAAKESYINLTGQNVSLTKQVHTLVEQLSAAKESYRNLTGQNISQNKPVNTLVEQLSAAKQSFGNLTKKNNSLTKQVNTLVEQLSAAQESFGNLTGQRNSLAKQVNLLKELLNAAKESFKSLSGQNIQQINTLVEQLSAAKQSFGYLTQKNNSLNKQVNTLVEELSAAKQSFGNLTQRNNFLTRQVNTLVEQISAAKTTLQNSINEEKQFRQIISRLQKQNQELATQKALFGSQIQRLSSLNQGSNTKSQAQTLKSQISNLRLINESLKKEQVTLYSAIAQNDQILKEVQILRKQKEQLTQSCVHADAYIANLQKESKKKQTKLGQFSDQIQTLQAQKASIQKDKIFFQQKLYSAEAYINSIQIQKDLLLKKIQQLKSEIESLKEFKNTTLQQSSIQLSKEKIQKQNLQKNLSQSNEKMRYISNELQRLKSLLTQSQQKSIVYSKKNLDDAKKIIQMEKELKNEKQIREELKSVIDQLSKPKQDQKVVQLTEQNNNLKETNHKLNTQLQEKPKIQQKLKEAEQFIKKLQGELALQDQKMHQIHKNLSQKEQMAVRQMREISEKEQNIKEINMAYNQIQQKLSKTHSELLRVTYTLQDIEFLKQKLKTSENALYIKDQQIKGIQAKLQQAEQFIRHLQSEIAKLSNPILKSSINSSSSLHQGKGIQSQGEISNMSVDLKELQSKLIAKEEELVTSNHELIMIRQKLNNLQNRINDDDSIDNSHQITLLNDRLKFNQEELLQQKIRNQNLIQVNTILENQNQSLKKSLEQLTNQIEQLKNTIKYYELRLMQVEQSPKKSGSQINIQKSSSDQNLEKVDNELQVPKDNKSQQSVGSQDKQRQQEYLRLKLLQKQQLIDKLKQTIQNLTEELGEKLTDEENNQMMENQKTKQLVEEIKKLKQKLDTTQVYVKQLQNVRDQHSQLGSKSSKSSTQRLAKQQQIVLGEKSINNDDTKTLRLIQKLINYINEYDSLDMFKQENIQKQLKGSAIFAQLFETIKMKLMLLNALDVQKQTRLQNKQQEINSLNKEISTLKEQLQQYLRKAAEADVISQRYQEVLGEVIQYQRLNKNLQDQINNLNNQLSIHKSQLDEFSKQIQNNSSSLSSQLSPRQVPINDQQLKEENHQLRKKLEDAQYELLSIKSSVEGYMNGELIVSPKRKDQGYNFQLFLRECLDNIQRIENNIADVQNQLNQNKQNVQRLIHILKSSDRLGSKRSDQSNIVQKLQDLQQKLLLNDRRLKQHQEQSQVQIINLMKQTLSNSQNLLNKTKIQDYLNQLQHNIYRNNEQHQQQIERIKYYYQNLEQNKNKSPRTFKEVSGLKSSGKNDRLQKSQNRNNEQGLTEQDRKNFDNQDLLRQINGLTNHIQIYHQEAARMKDKFKKTIEGLVKQIEQMKQAYDSFDKQNPTVKQTNPLLNAKVNEIMQKVHFILQNDVKQADEKSDYYADDDYIMTNNYVQYIKSKDQAQQQKEFLHNIKSIADEFQNKESSSLPNLSQNPNILNFSNLSNNDIMSKPFLEYIINNRDLDKEEVNLLKKKINQMKAKQVKENLNYLKENQNKLQELMKKKNQIFAAQNVLPNTQYRDLIFNTMANNFSKDQISQIFGSEDNDELLNKLNEVLGMDGQSSSYIKNQNSSEMMKQIEIIKNRYYKQPSQLSEEVYQHLVKLLSAKDDSEFYMLIDSMFKLIFQLEQQYEKTIAQKDELYRIHTEKMNKIFNRSSSDESQDYRTLLMEEQAFNVNKEEKIHLSQSKIKDGLNQLQTEIQKANNQLNN